MFGHVSGQHLGTSEGEITGMSIAPVPHSQTSYPLRPFIYEMGESNKIGCKSSSQEGLSQRSHL